MESATLTRPRPGQPGSARWRAPDSSTWARIGFAMMCVAALVGYLAFPTYPTYDSFYALLWGRDVLHLHLPDFAVYRAPTEHPLAIAFGALCSLFGQGGARLMVLGSIGSFVAAVAGIYRLGRLCFGPAVGLVAALLLLSRFFVENLAAQGYLDISYVALIVWALALEVERPRRGASVLALLAAAGLLRPDAWVLSGVYWLWLCWPLRRAPAVSATAATPATPAAVAPRAAPSARLSVAARYMALAATAPAVWVAVDWVVTGSPLHSLTATAGLAQELERTHGLSSVLGSVWSYSVRIDKLPVLLGAIAGVLLAASLAPRRALVPLGALAATYAAYVAEGAAGASVVDRYLLGAATLALLFCAVTVGGWAMLEPGSWLRRVWIAAAVALVGFGAYSASSSLSLSGLRTTLAEHKDFHEGLAAALHSPGVRGAVKRCGLLSLPDNKLIPDARWILDTTGQRQIVARSQARADARRGRPQLSRRLRRGSVAVYPLGSAVFVEAIVDVGDDALDQVPEKHFRRIYTSRYYAVYANC